MNAINTILNTDYVKDGVTKFDEAIEIFKSDYMFMYEMDDVLYFKNAITKQYIQIERDVYK